jgi:small-conductance mechanosensitive channel
MDEIERDEAAAGLASIDATQERLIDRVAVPAWYWWLVAVLMVGLGALVDLGRPVAVAVGALAFAVAVGGATMWVILSGGRAQVSRQLLGGEGAAWIVAFVGLVVVVSLAIGFTLRALGFPYPASLATVVGAAGVAGGGPLLMGRLRRTMLRQRTAR